MAAGTVSAPPEVNQASATAPASLQATVGAVVVGGAVGTAATGGEAVAAGVAGLSVLDGRSGAPTGDLAGASDGVHGGTAQAGTVLDGMAQAGMARLTRIPTLTQTTVTTGRITRRPTLRLRRPAIRPQTIRRPETT
jgi:hypothetical protein